MEKMVFSKLKLGVVTLFSLLCMSSVFADVTDVPFPQMNWTSKGSNDPFTIQNGSGTPITIAINVNGGPTNTPGVNIKNCGNTTHINAGSSAICSTNDANNPVTLTSDSTMPASGTYQIKPR